MGKKKDLTGQRFGRLVVLYETSERKHTKVVWHCRCDCGNEVDIRSGSLTSGHTMSCGCYKRERAAEVHTTHGMNRQGKPHSVYQTWQCMLQRCENPNNSAYKDYGGCGIKVCDEWHDAEKFIGWALANGWQKGLQLDRIDNNGNYEPSNCRWATREEQARNRRTNHLVTFNAKTRTMAEWAEEVGVKRHILYDRINNLHWPIERALTEPVNERLYNGH